MTRVLVFEGAKAAKRFELCRTAILSAGNGSGGRTRETIRKEARLLDALDSISEPSEPIPQDPDARSLKVGTSTLTLTQDDHALLTLYLDTTPWTPRVSRDVVDAQDWLSAAEKVET